jgi:c-di-GMP-binding flagellar brake protein YcgR
MRLAIGVPLGMRSPPGASGAMCRSSVIGIAPNHALFVTPPTRQRQPVAVAPSQNVEVIAVASQAVFQFVCTVEAVCLHPFDYLVLSRPGWARRLRKRRAMRVRTRLAVRHGVDLSGSTLDGLGIGCDLSVLGLSLATAQVVGAVGERLCVAFPLHTRELDVQLQAVAIIRSVQPSTLSAGLVMHRLEFDRLDGTQQVALKSFVFDHLDTAGYWSQIAA